MDTLALEYSKIVKKQKLSTTQAQSSLDSLINQITSSPSTPIQQLIKQSNTITTQLSDAQKDLYSSLSKFGKLLDKQKSHRVDLNDIWDPQAFLGKEDALNKAMATHFIREGRFECWEAFVNEAQGEALRNETMGLLEKFKEMYTIVEGLKKNQFTMAIKWACENREELGKRGSILEFELHKVMFINLLRDGKDGKAALAYAKTFLTPFQNTQSKEIQRLMCSFLFKSRLATSPYSDFLDPNLKTDLQTHFTRDFSSLLGLSSDPPLYISHTIGTCALPTIIKMSSVMNCQSGIEWSAGESELPVEIPLMDSHRYHSVFACPVSKEQATEENPPMMMLCGHVIAKESLTRLSKGSANRFKCPYCPTESTAAQAVRIYL